MRLEYATLAWNIAGTVVLLATAISAGSIALAGFGLDSLIEIFASGVVIWQLKGAPEERERRALRLIGTAFLSLAAYLLIAGVVALASGRNADSSAVGTIWVALTVVVMIALAVSKRNVGHAIMNPALIAEARVTLIDAAVAATVLAGLLLDSAVGLTWADPAAALAIALYALREGVKAISDTVAAER